MRFPRHCRFVARRFVLSSEFAVGQTFAADLSHGELEAFRPKKMGRPSDILSLPEGLIRGQNDVMSMFLPGTARGNNNVKLLVGG